MLRAKDEGRIRVNPRWVLLAGGAVVLFAASAIFAGLWWNNGRFLVSTDFAYMHADDVIISPKIPAYILEIPVGDNRQGKAGEINAANAARP